MTPHISCSRRVIGFLVYLCLAACPAWVQAQGTELGQLNFEETDCLTIDPRGVARGNATLIITTTLDSLNFAGNRYMVHESKERSEEYWLVVRPTKRKLTIRADHYISLDVNLPPLAAKDVKCFEVLPFRGTLTIDSDPENARILEIGGEFYDPPLTTPYTLERKQARPYSVTMTKEGYDTLRTTVVVPPNASTTSVLPLSKLVHTLTLTSSPSGAEVVVNGKVVGRTPHDLVVEVGKSTSIEFRYPDYLSLIDIPPPLSVGSSQLDYFLNPIRLDDTSSSAELALRSAQRKNNMVILEYDLIGDANRLYKIGFTLEDASGRGIKVTGDQVDGVVGKKIKPGNGYQVIWRLADTLPRDAHLVLSVKDMSPRSLPFWVAGGLVVGTSGVLCLTQIAICNDGGGEGGGGGPDTEPPTGDMLPDPPGRQ